MKKAGLKPVFFFDFMELNVVLVEPEIPQNTGNIVRTCAATGAHLHLIEPLGFSLKDKYLKRAGLDYWPMAEITVYPDLEDFYAKNGSTGCYYVTTKGLNTYSELEYPDRCFNFGIAEPDQVGASCGLALMPTNTSTSMSVTKSDSE